MKAPQRLASLLKRKTPHSLLIVLLAVFLWTGGTGLNFGLHWDEGLAFEEITRPLESGVFLPRSYNYASMLFDIGTIALLPKTIPFLVKTGKEAIPLYSQGYEEIVPAHKVAPLVEYAKSREFHLRFRRILLVISSLTGLWVFLAVRACKRSAWEALFAAAVVLTSWELAYHSRWVAPDAVQMQFAALWLMFFALALYSGTRPLKWLRFASAAAGLGAGTKYQGGILLLPVLIYAVVVVRATAPRIWPIAKEILSNVGVFFLVFLITTPGFLLDPLAFWQSVRHIGHQYSTGHYGYTVSPFFEHGYLLLGYLALVVPSHWPALAAAIAVAAVLGVVAFWQERRATAVLLLCGPLAYALFATSFRVMMARNYLLLAPFVAFFAARGAHYVWERLGNKTWIRSALVLGCIGIFVTNAVFLWIAAQTIVPQTIKRAKDMVAYLKKHPRESFYLSRATAALVENENVKLSNVTEDPAAAERFLFHSDELERTRFSCNRPWQYRLVSGRLEVNFNYYADWEGQGKVLDMSMKRARELQLFPQPQ